MEYKDGVKKKVARQVRIVKEDATDAEIDEVMASGGTQQVLQSAILRTAADPVREAFEKAQDKYRDVQRLGQVHLHPNSLCTTWHSACAPYRTITCIPERERERDVTRRVGSNFEANKISIRALLLCYQRLPSFPLSIWRIMAFFSCSF